MARDCAVEVRGGSLAPLQVVFGRRCEVSLDGLHQARDGVVGDLDVYAEAKVAGGLCGDGAG